MATGHHTNGTDQTTGYVPYFYASGRFQYQHIGGRGPGPALPSASSYRFASDDLPDPSVAALPSVETILARGYLAVPNHQPETALLSDKRDTAWLGLDDVIQQVGDRRQLYQQNMYELTLSMCEANNAVFRIERDRGQPATDKHRSAADKMIQQLYEQQRAERINLWRDVNRLRLELPERVGNYLSAYRKAAILATDMNFDPDKSAAAGDEL